MQRPRRIVPTLLTAIALFAAASAGAEEVRIAVASNFIAAAREIASRFEEETGHRVLLSPGSTGKHYAQIVGGAPYDAFLAADTLRPALLEGRGLGAGDGRFTYATGRLVLWSPRPAVVDPEGEVLRSGRFRHLSLANPKLAPYGRAARQVLEAFGVWDKLSRRIVRGENVGQAFQFVASGNAQLGFVASSQLARAGGDIEGSWWVVPDSLYSPIQQQAILLNDTEAARAFLSLVRSNVGRNIIREFGYGTP